MPRSPSGSSARSRRSVCPVACSLDLLGDRWTLLVVRDLLLGKTTYKEFHASPESIATNILADRLARLVEAGIAERIEDGGGPRRPTYRPTPRGRALRPVLRALERWGLEQLDGTESRLKG